MLHEIVIAFDGLQRPCAKPDSASRTLLHIGTAFGHAELLAADVGEHGEALPDFVMRGTGKAQPQPAF